jgi:hypothetical protein
MLRSLEVTQCRVQWWAVEYKLNFYERVIIDRLDEYHLLNIVRAPWSYKYLVENWYISYFFILNYFGTNVLCIL